MSHRTASLHVKDVTKAERRLTGRQYYLARGGYLVILLIVVSLFILGIPGYDRYLNQGRVGVEIIQDAQRNIILNPVPGLEADQAGIRKGDLLLAVNDNPIYPGITLADVSKLLEGNIGESVKITVRTDNNISREYTINRSQFYLDIAKRFHISPIVPRIILEVLSIVSILAFGIISLVIFIRRSDDWLAYLVALALVAFAVEIPSNVLFGARLVGLDAIYYFLDSIASSLPILLLCLFPNGQFVPSWMRRFPLLLLLWAIASFFLLTFSPPWWTSTSTFWVWMLFFSVGIYAQIYRYLYVSKPVERQQIKWIVISTPFAVLATVSVNLVPEGTFLSTVLFSINKLANIFVAISLGLAIFRYKLWDTDFYINRAWVYSVVTGTLAIFWWLTTNLLQVLLNQFDAQGSPFLAVAISSVQVVALFRPVRDWVQNWINVRFYRDRVDFTKAIVELQPENWHFISARDVYQTLTENAAKLLGVLTSAAYLYNGKSLHLVSTKGDFLGHSRNLKLGESIILDLKKGKVVQYDVENSIVLLVPLVVSRQSLNDLVGILVLGPRLNDRGYSRDHINDLKGLGERAGMAIYFLQLNEKKKASRINYQKRNEKFMHF